MNNTNLQNGHDGLKLIAKKQLGVDINALGAGEMVAFLNRAGDKVKVYASGDVIAYMRAAKDRKIDPRTIALIPKYFSGTTINYDKAIRQVLREKFPKWFEKSE